MSIYLPVSVDKKPALPNQLLLTFIGVLLGCIIGTTSRRGTAALADSTV